MEKYTQTSTLQHVKSTASPSRSRQRSQELANLGEKDKMQPRPAGVRHEGQEGYLSQADNWTVGFKNTTWCLRAHTCWPVACVPKQRWEPLHLLRFLSHSESLGKEGIPESILFPSSQKDSRALALYSAPYPRKSVIPTDLPLQRCPDARGPCTCSGGRAQV